MTQILKGGPAAAAIAAELVARSEKLKQSGIQPCLALIRVGEDEGAMAYERGASRRCEAVGVELRRFLLPESVSSRELLQLIEKLNAMDDVHGVLLLQPLPESVDMALVRKTLSPAKDVDGITNGSLAGVYSAGGEGYPPCCAASCMEMLRFYGIPTAGKRAVVVGRSLVVGRPAAMLLMHADATVTLCHRRTENLPELTRSADILVLAAGEPGLAGAEFLSPGQTVLDVGVSVDPVTGKLCGDAVFSEADGLVAAITPVIGGIGAITNTILAAHVIDAAEKTTFVCQDK